MSLIDAIENENYELADQLITKGYGLDETDYYGYTPLISLLWKVPRHKVRLEFITKLIDASVDVNIKNHAGWTALFFAVYINNSIRVLIDAGADINIKNNNGDTALSYAIKHKHYRIYSSVDAVKMLIEADY